MIGRDFMTRKVASLCASASRADSGDEARPLPLPRAGALSRQAVSVVAVDRAVGSVKMLPVKSSNVEAVGYDPAARVMHVQFRGGAVYHHADVSAADHARFMASGSKGKHYHAQVKGKYAVRKL